MKSTLRILCLEDDEEDFILINYTLEESDVHIETRRVDTREKYLEALQTYDPDVILSDHSLPKFNSTEALLLCQASELQIPFILVTGAVSDEFAVNCIKLGADDYVLKSSLSRLPTAIKNAIKHKETEKAKQKAIASLAARNEELLKINNELDSFVYSVSHNLRAPLMSVLGLVNLAKRETEIENMNGYHRLMETSIHKLDDTLKEILDYSRNARQDLKIEPVDFKKVIGETLEKMQFMPGFGLLDIKVSIDNSTSFFSDYYRISVIMNNLVSNAIKYLDSTKEKSYFSISIETDDTTAKLTFKDNGIGIEENLVPKIFDMFFRATNRKDGSGLGLYIVKEAVDKLQGRIEIESGVGNGTVFTIEIPNHLSCEGQSDQPRQQHASAL